MMKPDGYMVIGFTSGKSAELTEEEGLRLKRLLLDSTTRHGWFETVDIYGCEIGFRTDTVIYWGLETDETTAKYNELNPKDF